MKSTMKRSTSVLLIALLMLSATSCGDEKGQGEQTTPPDNETTTLEGDSAYTYPEIDLKNDEFTILNTAQTYGFYSTLDFEAETGDTLDDEIYKRNRFVEEKFNMKINVVEDYELDQAAKALQTSVLAGDDTYDVAFIRDYYLSTAITENYLMNLDEIPELKLDEEWWDGTATENARIGKDGKALFAATDISLVDFEGTMVTFINEDMFEKLNLELPYQLVIDGNWTFDKMVEYMKIGANLNGDENFKPFNASGAAVYGMVGFQHSYNSLISSAGIDYIKADKNGNLIFDMDNERFYDVAIKISQTFAQDGEWLFANSGTVTNPAHYEMIFKNGRSLMMIAQLKAANNYRDMDSTYGILPVPKYDETQENYSNLRTFSYLMVVPTTNTRPHETGAIMDAMSYLTYENVVPTFYDGRISQKMLRNDESIQMLNMIRSTRHYDLGTVFGVYNDLSNIIMDVINKKSTDFASGIASIKPSIEAKLETFMNSME